MHPWRAEEKYSDVECILHLYFAFLMVWTDFSSVIHFLYTLCYKYAFTQTYQCMSSRWYIWPGTLKTWWCPTTSFIALYAPWATGERSRSSAGDSWTTSVSKRHDTKVTDLLKRKVYDNLLFVSVVGYGSWFEHVQEFWEHRMDSNVLFLKYEDMYKVLPTLTHTVSPNAHFESHSLCLILTSTHPLFVYVVSEAPNHTWYISFLTVPGNFDSSVLCMGNHW